MYIRNFDETRDRVRAFAIHQIMTGLIRQYGVDDLLRGLQHTYREAVFSRAKSSEPVKQREALLTITVEKLNEVSHAVI